jgi:hypothetical protein
MGRLERLVATHESQQEQADLRRRKGNRRLKTRRPKKLSVARMVVSPSSLLLTRQTRYFPT